MSILSTTIGLLVRGFMTALSRFYSPKDVVVDIAMDPNLFVQENLRKQNLRYHFSRKEQIIARQREGWRIALGRKLGVLTEQYVDKRHELVLMCKEA